MIRIDRSAVPVPAVLLDRGVEEIARAAEDIAQAAEERRRDGAQVRHRFTIYRAPAVKDALSELFHGKCAYCESRIGHTQPMDIEMFRPKGAVVEAPEHPGYWWLANDWDNLLPACIDCNRQRVHGTKHRQMSGKGNRFPLVDETTRVYEPGDPLDAEEPLLLDPCVDHPDDHLAFDWDGTVSGRTERGQTTITVLGLNRPGLVDARSATAAVARRNIRLVDDREIHPDTRNEIITDLVLSTGDDVEFAAMHRQLLLPHLTGWLSEEELAEVVNDWGGTWAISEDTRRVAQAAQQAFDVAQATYSLDDDAGVRRYKLQPRLIEGIEIRNVKAIKSLSLDLTAGKGDGGPWLMLLGENGTGKSTVLQAIALALAGEDYLRRLVRDRGIRLADFVRHRCKSGQISIALSGFPEPLTLTFRHDRVEYRNPTGDEGVAVLEYTSPTRSSSDGWEPLTPVLGYGATRLLPRGDSVEYGGRYGRIDNLFDPFVPLLDADGWLRELSKQDFDRMAIVIKDVLSLPDQDRLTRRGGEVRLKAYGATTSVHQQSDGYQAIIATIADMMDVILRLWGNPENAEGIVLLDEIGAHLHPTWKMRIVSSLRTALPGVQVIATTHQPLCLRGLDEGEVVVMRRDDQQVSAITDLPSPGDFRVDQLLTSQFFGLSTTVDPEVEAVFDEYYALLALDDPTTEQLDRTRELQSELRGRRHLGNTKREELMYEAIDQALAETSLAAAAPLHDIEPAVVEQVSRIWQDALSSGEDR